MKVQLTLIMKDLVVNGQPINQLIIQWPAEVNTEDISQISIDWFQSQNSLVQKMSGLQRCGESSLAICPLQDPP